MFLQVLVIINTSSMLGFKLLLSYFIGCCLLLMLLAHVNDKNLPHKCYGCKMFALSVLNKCFCFKEEIFLRCLYLRYFNEINTIVSTILSATTRAKNHICITIITDVISFGSAIPFQLMHIVSSVRQLKHEHSQIN